MHHCLCLTYIQFDLDLYSWNKIDYWLLINYYQGNKNVNVKIVTLVLCILTRFISNLIWMCLCVVVFFYKKNPWLLVKKSVDFPCNRKILLDINLYIFKWIYSMHFKKSIFSENRLNSCLEYWYFEISVICSDYVIILLYHWFQDE